MYMLTITRGNFRSPKDVGFGNPKKTGTSTKPEIQINRMVALWLIRNLALPDVGFCGTPHIVGLGNPRTTGIFATPEIKKIVGSAADLSENCTLQRVEFLEPQDVYVGKFKDNGCLYAAINSIKLEGRSRTYPRSERYRAQGLAETRHVHLDTYKFRHQSTKRGILQSPQDVHFGKP